MPEPSLRVLGIYRPYISEETYQEQWQVTESDDETKEHFEKLVLIEAIADELREPLRLDELGQEVIFGSLRSFQCAYDEALLTTDGEAVIQREFGCVKGTGPLRFAFYLHFYDPERPLNWSYGSVECPEIQPASERLRKLVPYNATD
jgi:hypothetical protein